MTNLNMNPKFSKLSHKHPFHLVKPSAWPFLLSINLLYFILVFVSYGIKHGKLIYDDTNIGTYHNGEKSFLFSEIPLYLFVKCPPLIHMNIFMSLMFMFMMFSWFWDIIVEGTYQGHHTKAVEKGLRLGMILFIVSEIMFFFGMFWAFFHSSLSPNIEIGAVWPPKGMITFDPWKIPLLNTIILLTSGASVTWAHHGLVGFSSVHALHGLLITMLLGMLFTLFQAYEYKHALFTMQDTVYGSVFFLATGFHGFHVIMGTIFLFVCFLSCYNYHFTGTYHFGFEAAAWYWHFVDVVWLFLFMSIYWWGS